MEFIFGPIILAPLVLPYFIIVVLILILPTYLIVGLQPPARKPKITQTRIGIFLGICYLIAYIYLTRIRSGL